MFNINFSTAEPQFHPIKVTLWTLIYKRDGYVFESRFSARKI